METQMQQETRIRLVSVDEIQRNPFQPRRRFDQNRLQELAESIRHSGLAQPILLRPDDNGGLIQVFGERRVLAFKLLGKTEIPSLIQSMTPQQARELTAIENLQRDDLTPIEEALSFKDLVETCDGNISEAARKVGKDNLYVARRLKLLMLPQQVQDLIGDEKLPLGIALVLKRQ
mgnify:CR=1 FL=1